VLIPWQNVQHLVLDAEVREAMAKGRFHVWPVRTVEQGIEIITGVEAGQMQADGTYPAGTLMARVAARLDQLRQYAENLPKNGVKRGLVAGSTVRAKRARDGHDADAGGGVEDDDFDPEA
jgi:hypothetical protein